LTEENNRLEILRLEIDRLVMKYQEKECRYFFSHLYGVSEFCVLLAKKRGLNPEIAATCGMLHDVYQVTAGIPDNHAAKGAEKAEEILKELGLYGDEEISAICGAIRTHSDKYNAYEGYAEVLIDADVLSHCLYNPDFPPADKEVKRFGKMMDEFAPH
jgi:uncharacterized protein